MRRREGAWDAGAAVDHGPPERTDGLAKELAKKLQEVQAERDELAIAERVLNRLAEQARADAGAVAPVPAKAARRAVLLIPHRSDAADEGALPGDYRKILAIVREADGPVQRRSGRSASSWGWTPRCAASWNLCGPSKLIGALARSIDGTSRFVLGRVAWPWVQDARGPA